MLYTNVVLQHVLNQSAVQAAMDGHCSSLSYRRGSLVKSFHGRAQHIHIPHAVVRMDPADHTSEAVKLSF